MELSCNNQNVYLPIISKVICRWKLSIGAVWKMLAGLMMFAELCFQFKIRLISLMNSSLKVALKKIFIWRESSSKVPPISRFQGGLPKNHSILNFQWEFLFKFCYIAPPEPSSMIELRSATNHGYHLNLNFTVLKNEFTKLLRMIHSRYWFWCVLHSSHSGSVTHLPFTSKFCWSLI